MAVRNFAIRLDVKGEAAVRKALQGLGKDGQRALRLIEKGGPKASRGLLAVDRASKQLQGSFAGLAGRAGPLGAALGALGPAGLAAAAGLGALTLGARAALRGAREAVDELDEIGKVADKIGLSTDALQELRFAADLAGVSQRTLDLAMQRFSRRIAEAAKGQGELRGTLAQYNIQLRDSEGRIRAVDKVLNDYADAIKNAESEQEQLRLAFKGFDSEGAALVNLLRRGSEEMDRMRANARELGVVFDENLIREAERTKNVLTTLSTVINANMNRALFNLAPILVNISRKFADFTKAISDAGGAIKDAFSPSAEQQLEAIEARIAALKAAAATPAGQLFPSSARAPKGPRGSIVGAVSGPGNPQRRPGTGGIVDELELLERQAAALQEIIALKAKAAASAGDAGAAPTQTELRAEVDLERFIEGLRVRNGLMRASGEELASLTLAQEALTLAREQDLAVGRAENLARQAGRELSAEESRQIREQVADFIEMTRARANLAAQVKIEAKALAESAKAQRVKQALDREGQALLAGVATETEKLIAFQERLNELREKGALKLHEVNLILARTKEALKQNEGVARDLEQTFTNAFDNMEDSIVRFAKTGKISFADFADSLIDDLLRIAIRAAILKPFENFLGGLDFSRIFSSSGVGIGGGLGGGPSQRFVRGGIMTEHGPLPLRTYTGGGIARTPQVAIFGDGSVPEAYVPVPSGRIPVEFRGGGRAAPAVKFEVHVHDQRGQGAPVEVSRQRGPDGREIIGILIRDTVNSGILRGDYDRSLGTRFGTSPGTAVR